MTFTQLEYVIAVDNYRHFADAAKACFVTQPTLSMQLQKLEDELGFKIFDRSKQPVLPTENGLLVIEHAKKIISERNALHEMVAAKKGVINGELKLGIIPTLAPYLLPLFVQPFIKKYPKVKLIINELTTEHILHRLKDGRIDAGILVTPLPDANIKETPLFYEELMAYVSHNNQAYKKSYVLPNDIDPSKLWLLEEGHCFRSQIINLCELRKQNTHERSFEYEAGSLEALRRMVERYDGITILPELATLDLTAMQKKHLRFFKHPAPVREVSLVTHRSYIKQKLIQALQQEIMNGIPQKIKENKKRIVVPV